MEARVRFEDMPWDTPAPGLRLKAVQREGKQVRLVEFSPEFQEPDWCLRGHSGLVLEGELHLDIAGEVVVYKVGDAITLASGEAMKHRHVHGSPRVLLFLVEDL